MARILFDSGSGFDGRSQARITPALWSIDLIMQLPTLNSVEILLQQCDVYRSCPIFGLGLKYLIDPDSRFSPHSLHLKPQLASGRAFEIGLVFSTA
jgi:hypothetical protein